MFARGIFACENALGVLVAIVSDVLKIEEER
jgi:hypothetical protein